MSKKPIEPKIPRGADGKPDADDQVDEQEMESFPASDPPSTTPSHAGTPRPVKQK